MAGYEDMAKIDYDTIVEIHKEAVTKGHVVRVGVKNQMVLYNIIEELKSLAIQRIEVTYAVATIMKRIAIGQPFRDGNRRTAYEVGQTILALFNLRMVPTLEEATTFRDELMWLTIPEVKNWIVKRISPLMP